VLTQRRALVSRARVGLGGVAGGGLTHWGDSYTFCLRPRFSSGLGAPLDKLSPVKATTLGGAFHCVSHRTEVGVATSYRQTIRLRSGRSLRPTSPELCFAH
jgi:hypothetical protein